MSGRSEFINGEKRLGVKSFLTEDGVTSEGRKGWRLGTARRSGTEQVRPRKGGGVSRGQSTRERSSKKAEQKIKSLWK